VIWRSPDAESSEYLECVFYEGTLGVGARKDIVEKIIVKVNALKGGG